MKHVVTSLEIAATPARVWSTLTDLSHWGRWNSVIPGMRGEARKGSGLRFWIRVQGLPPLYIAARVTRCEPEKVLAWGGGINGLVVGEHYLRLEPTERGCRLTHGEDFSGVLADRVLGRGVLERLERSYARFNESLKSHLEQA